MGLTLVLHKYEGVLVGLMGSYAVWATAAMGFYWRLACQANSHSIANSVEGCLLLTFYFFLCHVKRATEYMLKALGMVVQKLD